jgi:hypothetical protein
MTAALAELTQHDGLRVGIPTGGALLIMGYKEPPADMPKAKTMIRWFVPGAQGAYHSYVRDDLRHVRNLFPVAFQGLGWSEVEDIAGNTVLVPAGTANGGYQEIEDGVYQISLTIPTGPVAFQIRSSFEEVRKLAGLDTPPPPRPKAVKAAKTDAPAKAPTPRRKAASGDS